MTDGRLSRLGRNAFSAGRSITRTMRRPATYPGYLREAMWLGLNTALWPVGLVSDALKLDDEIRLPNRFSQQVPLRYLDPLAASTPIILLHGYFHNRSAFVIMKRALRRFGYRYVDTMNYNVIGHDIAELAAQLAEHVDEILDQTGAQQVHLVGHSLGGLVARYYIQCLDGHTKVNTCVTLGSPHKGSHAAWIGRGRAARQLRPGSQLFTEFARARKPRNVRFVCYYSNLDGLVLPPSNAKLTERGLDARNILVKDLGHLSLLISRPLLRSVAEVLADPDGVRARVSALPRARRSERTKRRSGEGA